MAENMGQIQRVDRVNAAAEQIVVDREAPLR